MTDTAMVQHRITHKVQARDDHPDGSGAVKWFGSVDGGESYLGLEAEPPTGAYIEHKSNTLPIRLAYPRGFRMLGLTLVSEPEAVEQDDDR